jgi:hypothetical protein
VAEVALPVAGGLAVFQVPQWAVTDLGRAAAGEVRRRDDAVGHRLRAGIDRALGTTPVLGALPAVLLGRGLSRHHGRAGQDRERPGRHPAQRAAAGQPPRPQAFDQLVKTFPIHRWIAFLFCWSDMAPVRTHR